ncbi:MAG: hypothetical protein J6U20_03695 [Fibrobacter sp.]|nr:hypothetical protein [Fibrobacter sp.]
MKSIFTTGSGLTFIDPRNGDRYPAFIMNGRLWLANNLRRYEAFQCVSHQSGDIDRHMGLLYRCDDELESIIPDGFRLPSTDEFIEFFSKWKELLAVHPLDVPAVLNEVGDIPLAGTAIQANPCSTTEYKDFGRRGVYLTNSRDEQGYRLAVSISRDGYQTTRVLNGEHASIRLTLNTEKIN